MLRAKRQLWLLRALRAGALMLVTHAVMAQGAVGNRYPIGEGDVAKALSAIGVSVDMSQVHLPAHVSAATALPKLDVVTADPLGNNQVRLELRCHAALECLPFLVVVDVKDPTVVVASIRSTNASADAARHPTRLQMTAAPKDRPELKVGSRAVLEIQDGHMDIHLQVLAIDAGAIGRPVRVSTLDRKKVFHAVVTGEGTVTGVME